MKKILLLLLISFLGLGIMHAKVSPSDQVIDPLILKPGDRIAVKGIIPSNIGGKQSFSFLGSADLELSWEQLAEDALTPTTSFILEDAGGMLKGYPYYYLKNEVTGQYLDYEFIDKSDGGSLSGNFPDLVIECRLVYTSNKKKAAAFAIVPSLKAIHWGVSVYPETYPLPEADYLTLLTRCKEYQESPVYVSINQAFYDPYVALYTDWGSWFEIFKLSSETDYVEDLKFLYGQASEQNFSSGDNWGDYNPDLVQEFENYKSEAYDLIHGENVDPSECERVYHALKTVWDNLLVSGPKPLVPGYYRIVSSYPEFMEKQGVEKSIYATNEGEVKWKNYDKEDPTMGWELLKNSDGTWNLKNLGTQQYVSFASDNSLRYLTDLDATGHSLEFVLLENKDFNIFYKSQFAMNAAGHNLGAGNSGNIMGWNEGTLSPAAWYLRPLSTDTAELFSQSGALIRKKIELDSLIEKSQKRYNQGWNVTIDTDPRHWLVTIDDYDADNMVVFSNADHNSWNPANIDGVGYVGLLDDDSTTYWQSCWMNKPDEEQFLQFKLNRSVKQFAVYLNRRNKEGNQATQLDFYVSNDTTDANGWVKAGSIKGLTDRTTDDNPELMFQSEPIYMKDAYQFVRVYWKSNSGHTHFAGFHLQNVEIQANSLNYKETIREQADLLYEVLQDAVQVLKNEQSALEDLTSAYEKLNKAYEEYSQLTPDATALKTYIEEVKQVYATSVSEDTYADITKIYPDPGTYRESDREQLKLAIESVEGNLAQFEENFTYTQSDIENLMQQLKDAFLLFKSKQRWVVAADSENSGVWYHIAASQRYYDITGKKQESNSDYETGEQRYIRHGMLYIKPGSDLMKGADLHVGTIEEMNANGVSDLDYATWRFVNVADTAYAIQNKATGLFVSDVDLQPAATQLSVNPLLFKLDEIGYGTFIMKGYDMKGQNKEYLHVQTAGQFVKLWTNHDLDGGSCWDIYTTDRTEYGDAVGDYQFPVINYAKVPLGEIMTCSFPVGLQSVTDNYSERQSVYEVTDAGNLGVVLSPKENISLQAGEPFFYLPGNDKNLLQSGQETIMRIQVASNPELSLPGCNNGLVGSYFPLEIPGDAYVLSERLPISLTKEISENAINQFNFAYLIPDDIVASGTSSESILIPYENMSLESSDSLLLLLDKSAGYLDYLGVKAGQYLDTIHFAETYTDALQKWSNVTEDQCRGFLKSLSVLKKALRLTLPETSGTYRLLNRHKEYWVSNVEGFRPFFENEVSVENSAFYYGDDKHLTGSLKHLQLNGGIYVTDSVGTEYLFREVVDVPGAVQVLSSDTTYLAVSDTYVYLTSDSTQATYWYLEDVSDTYVPTFEVDLQEYDGYGFTTLYLPVAVKLMDDMEAYVGIVEDSWLKMSKVEGNIVPPAVPVIIKGLPGKYSLPYDGYAVNDASAQNDLQGVFVDEVISKEINTYTLQIVDNELGFFKNSDNVLNAFKAYLNLPAGEQIQGLIWDDSDMTGIIDKYSDTENVEVYDLSGRRVDDMKHPGIYIVNGKKVVVK